MTSPQDSSPEPSPLGLTAVGEQLYRLVLRHPGSSTEKLSDAWGRSVTEVDHHLGPLLERGLVSLDDGVVKAAPPKPAWSGLINDEVERLAKADRALLEAQAQISTYVREYETGRRADRASLPLDVVPHGKLGDVMSTLIRHGEGELRFVRPDEWPLSTGQRSDTAVTAALRAGRSSRALYPVTVAQAPPPEVLDRVRAGERIRMLPSLPSRLAVFGSEAVLMPEADGGSSSTSLLLRQPALVAACVALFDQLWSSAVAVPGFDDADDNDSQRDLLNLLAKGAKDEQIARAMGVSVRTVRRWIADVLADLDANSRFQAGVEAARSGWL
jgi:DNA-binding CsgD family transcriptional regulator